MNTDFTDNIIAYLHVYDCLTCDVVVTVWANTYPLQRCPKCGESTVDIRPGSLSENDASEEQLNEADRWTERGY